MNNFKYKLGDVVENVVNNESGLIIGKFEFMPGCILYRIDKTNAVWDEKFIKIMSKTKHNIVEKVYG